MSCVNLAWELQICNWNEICNEMYNESAYKIMIRHVRSLYRSYKMSHYMQRMRNTYVVGAYPHPGFRTCAPAHILIIIILCALKKCAMQLL